MNKSGFTLVELMIVIAIVAILVALALPNYNESVRKARRSDAQQELLEFAGTAERIFTQNNSYIGVTLPASSDYYDFEVVSATTATSFDIRAKAKGAQVSDRCGNMTLSNTGAKTYTGTLAGCW